MESPESKNEATSPSTIRSASAPATPAASGSPQPAPSPARSASIEELSPASSESKARSAKRPPTFEYYKASLEALQLPGVTAWTESSTAQLLSAIKKLDKPFESFSASDWEGIAAELKPARTTDACRKKAAWLAKEGALGSDKVAEQEPATLETTDPSGSNETLPEPSISHLPVSIAEQPFSADDDLELLRLDDAKPGGWYKWISRQMIPKRHKKEVRERLEYLLAQRDRRQRAQASTGAQTDLNVPSRISNSEQKPLLAPIEIDLLSSPKPVKRLRLSPSSAERFLAPSSINEATVNQPVQQDLLGIVAAESCLAAELMVNAPSAMEEDEVVFVAFTPAAEKPVDNSDGANDLKLGSQSTNKHDRPLASNVASPLSTVNHAQQRCNDVEKEPPAGSQRLVSTATTNAEPTGTLEDALAALAELSKPL